MLKIAARKSDRVPNARMNRSTDIEFLSALDRLSANFGLTCNGAACKSFADGHKADKTILAKFRS